MCHLSVPMLNAFHDSPFLTPCLFFPFCFVPFSGSRPTIVVYIYIYLYYGPPLSICCSCVSAYHLLTPFFPLPPSLPACLPPSPFLFLMQPQHSQRTRLSQRPCHCFSVLVCHFSVPIVKAQFCTESLIFDGIFQSFYLCHHFVN